MWSNTEKNWRTTKHKQSLKVQKKTSMNMSQFYNGDDFTDGNGDDDDDILTYKI